jgi:hypothetical protein
LLKPFSARSIDDPDAGQTPPVDLYAIHRRVSDVNFSSLLDLVIGLLFTFMIFSLIASGVYETGARIFATRPRTLWKALRRLLDPDDDGGDRRPLVDAPADDSLTELLYAHPLIRQLEGRRHTDQFKRSRISHIPNTDFARALIDLIAPAGEDGTTLEDLRNNLRSSELLPEGLKRSLLALVADAHGSLDQARSDIGDWFDARMSAVSRYYKRNTRYVMAAIGVAVAIGFNVDAIGVASSLHEDDVLRAALSAQATAVVESCQTEAGDAGAVSSCIQTRLEDTGAAGDLPVGWPSDRRDFDLGSVLGWLIAGVAIGQGAPFWFDLLRRAGGVRK